MTPAAFLAFLDSIPAAYLIVAIVSLYGALATGFAITGARSS